MFVLYISSFLVNQSSVGVPGDDGSAEGVEGFGVGPQILGPEM